MGNCLNYYFFLPYNKAISKVREKKIPNRSRMAQDSRKNVEKTNGIIVNVYTVSMLSIYLNVIPMNLLVGNLR